MYKIPLNSRKGIKGYAIVDAEDYDYLSSHRWRLHPRGYAISNTDGSLMHRLILKAPKGMYIDHKNHDKLDNRRSNIHIVTQKQNMGNLRLNKNNRTGINGVQPFRDRYRVMIGGKYLGCYTDIKEAERIAVDYHKEYFSTP